MKRHYILFIALIGLILGVAAQVPRNLDYQGILRDADGKSLVNAAANVRFSLLAGSSAGSVVYSEEQSLTTNAYGLIQAKIGEGTALSGTFADVDWSTGNHFMMVEVDLGNGFEDFGTSKLSAVPYALYGEDADADATNEIQNLTLTGSVLEISDGNSVDLQVVNSDDQTISLVGNILTLEDGGTVDLSAFLDNTDTNTQLTESEVDEFVANNGYLTAETDDQAISLDGIILTLEDGGAVDLSAFLDDTDTQLSEAQVDAFVANNGYLTSETDDQALSLDGNILTLEDGGTVDLSAFLDNTDTQLTESEVDEFVANNGYLISETDDQAISLDGNILTLEDGGTVDLSAYLDDTDTQLSESEVDEFVANNGYLTSETDDQAISLDGNILTLEDGGTIDLSTFLDNTDAQDLSSVLGHGTDANEMSITNLADPINDQDATTKSYVDSEISSISNLNSSGDFEISEEESESYFSQMAHGAGYSGSDVGQTFVAEEDGIITQIGFNFFTDNTDIIFDILEGEGYGGVVIAKNTISSTAGNFTEHTLTNTARVVAGRTYTIRFVSFVSSIYFSQTDVYEDGFMFTNNGTKDVDKDIVFSVLINTPRQTSLYVSPEKTVAIGTDMPHTSAILEISSDSKGLLIPRMTVEERDAISSPAKGLLIYNIDENDLNKFDGTNWKGFDDQVEQLLNDDGDFVIESEIGLVLDVEQSEGGNGAGDVNGQSFTATTSGQLARIDYEISTSPSFDSPSLVTISFYEGNGFNGKLIDSQKIEPEVNGSTVTLILENRIAMVANEQITFKLEYIEGEVVVGLHHIAYNVEDDVYSGGNLYRASRIQNFQDMLFKTYFVESGPTLAVENNAVGIGTDIPHASAALEVESTTKGFLLPRLTTAERDVITSPAAGLMIFNTTTSKFNGYDGASWVDLH
ncbi:MAG: hypothetical protein JXR10_03990 [Cyclobacteriaceae bacterium]